MRGEGWIGVASAGWIGVASEGWVWGWCLAGGGGGRAQSAHKHFAWIFEDSKNEIHGSETAPLGAMEANHELATRMNDEAAKAVRYGGVDRAEALHFVTINGRQNKPAVPFGRRTLCGSNLA